MLAPIIINADEMMDTMACEINNFMESTSAVRLVNNFEGFAYCINA